MGRKLVFKTGIEIPGHALESNGNLWIYIDSSTLSDAYTLLSNTENTEQIKTVLSESETVFDGYTHLFVIREEDDGRVNAGLKKD